MIEIKNISKRYKIKNNEIIAIDNATFSFEKGKFYAIMGHSGSGKSTLIHCLGLLDNIDLGTISINQKNVSKLSDKEKEKIRSRTIGFVFQSFYLSPKLKAYENVMLPMYINTDIIPKNRKRRAIQLLEKFGLKDRIDHFPQELSGGEQQRVAIARALANNPDVILADEPTGNLDVENEVYVMETLKSLSKQNKCVIVVSHNDIVKKYADYILYMDKGKLSIAYD